MERLHQIGLERIFRSALNLYSCARSRGIEINTDADVKGISVLRMSDSVAAREQRTLCQAIDFLRKCFYVGMTIRQSAQVIYLSPACKLSRRQVHRTQVCIRLVVGEINCRSGDRCSCNGNK